MAEAVQSYFGRVHCMVVGPGMGRHRMMLEALKRVLQQAHKEGLPVVIDAGDGLTAGGSTDAMIVCMA
jgi:ATP-dependent NAD(P)H-hydrate dehydratase